MRKKTGVKTFFPAVLFWWCQKLLLRTKLDFFVFFCLFIVSLSRDFQFFSFINQQREERRHEASQKLVLNFSYYFKWFAGEREMMMMKVQFRSKAETEEWKKNTSESTKDTKSEEEKKMKKTFINLTYKTVFYDIFIQQIFFSSLRNSFICGFKDREKLLLTSNEAKGEKTLD